MEDRPLPSEMPSEEAYWDAPRLEQTPQAGLPIQVHIHTHQPLVSYIFIGATIIIFILQYAAQYFLQLDLPALLLAKTNQGIQAGQYWRLITPVLVHGGLLHFAFNMYALYIIGPDLERSYGRVRFFTLYLLAAMGGNTLSYYLTPNPSLGASTAIFGLIAAQIIFVLRNKKLFGERTNQLLFNLAMIVMVNLGLGMTPGIDNWGHLGGLLGGAAFARFAGPVMAPHRNANTIEISDQTPDSRVGMAALIEFFLILGIVIAKNFIAP